MIGKLREYVPDLHLKSKHINEFNDEHHEVSKMMKLIKKGWEVEYQFADKMVSDVELPIDLKINFKQPALFDDKLTLITKLVKSPSYMIEFNYEILKDGKIITLGYTKLIFLNSKTNKPVRCPKKILDAIN